MINETSQATAAGRLSTVVSGSDAPALKEGQVVKAVAQADAAGGQVALRIGNAVVEARTQLPLRAGEVLALRVEQVREQVVLKLLDLLQGGDPLAAGVRNALPRQLPVGTLLANLTAATRGDAPLPEPLRQAIETLRNQLPQLRDVTTPQGLQRAVADSGLLLESKLAQLVTDSPLAGSLPNDFKVQLLRLLVALRGGGDAATARPADPPRGDLPKGSAPAEGGAAPPGGRGASPQPAPPSSPAPQPAAQAATQQAAQQAVQMAARLMPPLRGMPLQPQPAVQPNLSANQLADLGALREALAGQTEGALARLQLHQITTAQAHAEGRAEWLLELPIRRDDEVEMVPLRINRDDPAHKPGRHGGMVSVTLAFDLGALGPLQAKVSLAGEDDVTVVFWAEQAETTREVHGKMPVLQENLRQVGLQVSRLAAHTGKPPEPLMGGEVRRHIILDARA